jgi:hypothetical protein
VPIDIFRLKQMLKRQMLIKKIKLVKNSSVPIITLDVPSSAIKMSYVFYVLYPVDAGFLVKFIHLELRGIYAS